VPCPALHRIAFPVVLEWCQKVTGDQGSARLEGKDDVVNAILSFAEGVTEAELAAVGARF
jgi:hypothetical protein